MTFDPLIRPSTFDGLVAAIQKIVRTASAQLAIDKPTLQPLPREIMCAKNLVVRNAALTKKIGQQVADQLDGGGDE